MKKIYADRETWKSLVLRAMDCNFSWDNAAREYEKIYLALAAGVESRAA